MNPRIRIAVAAVVVLGAAVAGLRWWQQRDGPGTGPLVLYGNVDIREVAVAFRQPGRLLRSVFEEGDAVKAGDVMAEIDPVLFRDAHAAAEADVRRAGAELQKLRNGSRPQDVRRADDAVQEADAAYRKADSDLRRQTTLADEGIASARTLEAARAARDQAAAALGAAQQALALQREGFRKEDVAAAAARLEAAEAARAEAQTRLDDTRVRAPADGVVLARVREPGSMVGSQEPVYTLSLGAPIYVRAYVGEPNLGRIAPGTRVTVRTDSSTKAYQGQIGFISPRAEFTPKSVETTDQRTDLVYRLRIVVTDADAGLRQGMPVTVRVDAAPAQAPAR
jgi:HlyD family secretion protein